MLDKTIDSALLHLRKQIIRGDGKGLEHAEALLAMRGIPMPRVLPPKRKDVAGKGMMRRMVTEALRDGPLPMSQLEARLAALRPDLSPWDTHHRLMACLYRMRKAGMVRGGGGKWWLAPCGTSR